MLALKYHLHDDFMQHLTKVEGRGAGEGGWEGEGEGRGMREGGKEVGGGQGGGIPLSPQHSLVFQSTGEERREGSAGKGEGSGWGAGRWEEEGRSIREHHSTGFCAGTEVACI